MSWYKWKRVSDILVLVEDQVSAIKLAPHYHAAALLGVNLSDAKVKEIKDQVPAYKYVYLCLDNDATRESIRTALHLRSTFPNLRVQGLEKDIKNMSNEELEVFLSRLTT